MTPDEVLERVWQLKRQNEDTLPYRMRIRNIMNGGADGIAAVMLWDMGKGASIEGSSFNQDIGVDLPTVNLMASGVERLAQQVGVPPTLKVPYGPRDSDPARRKAEKRERIVEGWDRETRMELQYPQIGRWLPGYGYMVWTLTNWKDPYTDQRFPYVRMRDPYSVYYSWLGPEQTPQDIGIVRRVPFESLEKRYPDYDWNNRLALLRGQFDSERVSSGTSSGRRGWEGKKTGVEVYEYICQQGTYLCAPEIQLVFDFVPNPLSTPPFVFAKRFSFDRLISQYEHVIGLTAIMAKLNILSLIAAEDSVFRETNIVGEMRGADEYEFGRFAINEFEPGTQISKPGGDVNNQIWAQVDRAERQLRIGAGYDVQQDAISPNSFATGQGMRELQSAANNNVRELQTVLRWAVQDLDTKRLEWDQVLYPTTKKKVYVIDGSREVSETYTPQKDIAGNYRTKRVYGMMATWDDNAKIVAGLQLLQARAIDTLTLQENLHGLDEISQINDRTAQEDAISDLREALRALAAQGDPRATAAIVEIADKPEKRAETLRKFFTPQEPQMSPEEEAMLGAPPGGGLIEETPPDVQTVLSRLTGGGEAEGGVQTVATARR